MSREIIESYPLVADGVSGTVSIFQDSEENVLIYDLAIPQLDIGTKALLQEAGEKLSREISVSVEEVTDPQKIKEMKQHFYTQSLETLKQNFSSVPEQTLCIFAGILLHTMYGLGEIELFLADDLLEEIAINNSRYSFTVFHKKYGWMKTTKRIDSEESIYNFASQIGRKVGRQISSLDPIMDAHLLTGDRVAATLFPISTLGNTITIRKFARSPWTIISLIANGTTSKEIVAFLWLAIQYEMNILVSGGTASGKTSFLNALSLLIPPKQRVISIEDTREIELSQPQYWNWVPLSSRDKNPEGLGEVTMLDLMIASLRMRPDRIIVGEVRRKEQAETMFEAMHTGHAVYTTMHADTVEQIKRRLLEPPIAIPKAEVEALHLIVVQHRDRRKNTRKTLEVAEVLHSGKDLSVNYVFRWRPRVDVFEQSNQSVRIYEDLNLLSGMTAEQIDQDLCDKKLILEWMLRKKLQDVQQIGKIMELYYRDALRISQAAKANMDYSVLFPS